MCSFNSLSIVLQNKEMKIFHITNILNEYMWILNNSTMEYVQTNTEQKYQFWQCLFSMVHELNNKYDVLNAGSDKFHCIGNSTNIIQQLK